MRTFSLTPEDDVRLEQLTERATQLWGRPVSYSQLVRAALSALEKAGEKEIKSALDEVGQPRFGFEPKKKKKRYQLTEEEHTSLLEILGMKNNL